MIEAPDYNLYRFRYRLDAMDSGSGSLSFAADSAKREAEPLRFSRLCGETVVFAVES